MSAAPAETSRLSPQEYLARERLAGEKHQYFDGEVFAMAGASREHSLIATNVIRELSNALRTGPCDVHGSDLRVHVPATGLYTYPDVSIACPPEFPDDERDTLLNPSVLVEVLSDSTEAYDRGKKFENYRSIASLRDYVLIAQDRMLIEHYTRQPNGRWLLQEIRAGGRLDLQAVSCAIAIEEIYLRVLPPRDNTSA